jgi:hypothetical protein
LNPDAGTRFHFPSAATGHPADITVKPVHLVSAAVLAAVLALADPASAQTVRAVHWINRANRGVLAALSAPGSEFVTDFKGTNDVTLTLVAGGIHSVYAETYGNPQPGNNPAYVTNFVGNPAWDTGDGTPGHLGLLETHLTSTVATYRFDFRIPLTPLDHLLVSDVDNGESYTLEAYVLRAGNYVKADLAGWGHGNFSGQTGQVPDAGWPAWDPAKGTLAAASGAPRNEPLVILTPDQTIDRVMITKAAVGNGSAAFQFVAEPPGPTLRIRRADPDVVLYWPGAYAAFALYSSPALGDGAAWTPVPTPPTLVGGDLTVTNAAGLAGRYYRLQAP